MQGDVNREPCHALAPISVLLRSYSGPTFGPRQCLSHLGPSHGAPHSCFHSAPATCRTCNSLLGESYSGAAANPSPILCGGTSSVIRSTAISARSASHCLLRTPDVSSAAGKSSAGAPSVARSSSSVPSRHNRWTSRIRWDAHPASERQPLRTGKQRLPRKELNRLFNKQHFNKQQIKCQSLVK